MQPYVFGPYPSSRRQTWVDWDGAFEAKECDRIIALCNSLKPQTAVVGPSGKGKENRQVRIAKVAWIEAVGMYNAMRFHGKNVIMLSYPQEGHGLSKRANRVDLTQRMLDYFDHYLMDKPAADWITIGVPFLEKPNQ